MKSIIISSNTSGGGKTTFTLGLMKALKNRGYDVQGYKVGPDYIDTAFHSEVTGNVSRNLDIFLTGEDEVKYCYLNGNGDMGVIEGVMGLYDGKGVDEEYSTYHISKVLDNAPIILVLSPKASTVTLAAEINGLINFKSANIVGIVFSGVSQKYYELLKVIIEANCNIKVFGYIPKDERIRLESRHLGLIQSVEVDNILEKIDVCAELVEKYVDLNTLMGSFKELNLYNYLDKFSITKSTLKTNKVYIQDKIIKNKNFNIAIAYDEAFRFYYKENLELFEDVGKVVYFSPLRDKELPKNIDFLYLGGGYPEVFKEELQNNKSMRESINKALNNGLRCYGECGGLMYLTDFIDGYEMVGFFNGIVEMTRSLQRFGYAIVKCSIDEKEYKINCHEFHKSKVLLKEETIFEIEKENYQGEKITWNCGYKKKNTIAGYPHINFRGNVELFKAIIGYEL